MGSRSGSLVAFSLIPALLRGKSVPTQERGNEERPTCARHVPMHGDEDRPRMSRNIADSADAARPGCHEILLTPQTWQGRGIGSGTVCFRDETSEPTGMYSRRVPEPIPRSGPPLRGAWPDPVFFQRVS